MKVEAFMFVYGYMEKALEEDMVALATHVAEEMWKERITQKVIDNRLYVLGAVEDDKPPVTTAFGTLRIWKLK